MFWVELILVLAIIFLVVRKGGTFLAMAGNYDCGNCSSCNNAGMWGIGFPGSHSRKDSSQES